MSRSIDPGAALPLLVGIVAIVGIGLTAGALPAVEDATGDGGAPVQDEEDGGQGGQAPGQGGPTGGNVSGSNNEQGGTQLSTCVEPLASTLGMLGVGLGFLAIVGLIYYRFSFSAALLGGWTILPPVLLSYFLLTNCGGKSGAGGGGGPANIPGGGVALDTSVNVPPWAMLGLVGVVFVAAFGLMYRSLGEEDTVTLEDEAEAEPELDEFAEAAGRAADRIEEHDVDVDNAVYEAWVEMVGLLEVDNPDVYAPGEFAEVAIDLGMNEPDVRELTELFNEVRYGDRDAATREDRALGVLRNIESEYSADEEER